MKRKRAENEIHDEVEEVEEEEAAPTIITTAKGMNSIVWQTPATNPPHRDDYIFLNGNFISPYPKSIIFSFSIKFSYSFSRPIFGTQGDAM